MTDAYTEKLLKYADLVVPATGCQFGDPIPNCPFILFHQIGNESGQIEQISMCPSEELDKMRAFHRDCMRKYINRKWNPENPKMKLQ
ncbi:hypothetical protein [Aquipluma nitroreducens]|uniref:hypothetical protein n=1 Tax=Aquipluma nitroreducens TaxID=2010828 RepID=UPI00296FDB38|nr:hypothetical protein [Aquipluma nitroreducens]